MVDNPEKMLSILAAVKASDNVLSTRTGCFNVSEDSTYILGAIMQSSKELYLSSSQSSIRLHTSFVYLPSA
jgi:hypothetical protein